MHIAMTLFLVDHVDDMSYRGLRSFSRVFLSPFSRSFSSPLLSRAFSSPFFRSFLSLLHCLVHSGVKSLLQNLLEKLM